MKRQLSIIGKESHSGIMAVIHVETDADWVPMVIDQDVSQFMPDMILKVCVLDENGSSDIGTLTNDVALSKFRRCA